MTTLTTTEDTALFPEENTPYLHASLIKLEAIFNARHKTDHVFMNWWVGTFLMNIITLGIYPTYRFIRRVHIRNQHIQRTRAFYTTLSQIIPLLPQSAEKLTGQTKELLEDYDIRLESNEAVAMAKPLHWKPLAFAYGLMFVFGIVFYIIMIQLIMTSASAGHQPDPSFMKNQMASITPYSHLINLINFPFGIYWYYLLKRSMEDYPHMDKWEASLTYYLQPLLRQLSNNDNRISLPFEPQCERRNFWIFLLLLIPTLGINYLYIDYCCIHEAQRRFKESARVQYRILQTVKKLAGQSPDVEKPQ
ncbi:MAG: hypothetical protein H2174_08840 [Vampirovibrio sp.]|nr:hypothetical protein [Vampirovibrio sp.]